MRYNEIKPSEKYAGFIKMFWTLDSESGYTHHSLADTCPELLFHLDGVFDEMEGTRITGRSFTAGVHGQTFYPARFSIDTGFSMFGVRFYPHALPFLFNVPASELTNTMPDLRTLLGNEGRELEEKIGGARNHSERICIIEQFVENKLTAGWREELPVFHCIRSIIANGGQEKVTALSSRYYLSERQFQRQFHKYAGLTPKLFSRIVRFLAAAGFYGGPVTSLTRVALECGYYDQSHFIHDFKRFSGLHPGQYFSGLSDATAWRD